MFEKNHMAQDKFDTKLHMDSLGIFYDKARVLYAKLGLHALKLHPNIYAGQEVHSADVYSVFSINDPSQIFSEIGVGYATARGADNYMLFRTDYFPSNNDLMRRTLPYSLPGYRQQYNIIERIDGTFYGTATRNIVNVPPFADYVSRLGFEEHRSFDEAVDVLFDISQSDTHDISNIIYIFNTVRL